MYDRERHPRPDFYRQDWIDLNGEWQFAFDEEDQGVKDKWYLPEKKLNRTILVPFCYQSVASGINDQRIVRVMWYRRAFVLPENFTGKRVLVRFGAVDYRADVWVNGQYIDHHEGGYSPFAMDITDALHAGENEICLRAEDAPDRAQPRGKQYWQEGWKRCWYIPCSGIWQSVYLEAVPELHLTSVHITPDIDSGFAFVSLTLNQRPKQPTDAVLSVSIKGKETTCVSVRLNDRVTQAGISMLDPDGIEDIRLWSPLDPAMYDLKVTLVSHGTETDCVITSFGMRKIQARNGYIMINNRAVYLRMVLDQGYWPDTLMTPPNGEALRKDIELTLAMGFNAARKHQKIEDPRYYYWADRLGLLVWGELPAAFEASPTAFQRTVNMQFDQIERDFNHPSIICWVPMNESWGMTRMYANKAMQHSAETLYNLCKGLDPSRLVSTNDGWENVKTDILGIHDYTRNGDAIQEHFNTESRIDYYAVDSRMCCSDNWKPTGNEALVVTEFGGVAIAGKDQGWGYNDRARDADDLLDRYKEMIRGIHQIKGCRGYCYTQLTDVQQEVNGLLTPDRNPKVELKKIKMLNRNPLMEKADF